MSDTTNSTSNTGNGTPEQDLLTQIRDRLGELPIKIADQLRQGRDDRFGLANKFGGGRSGTSGGSSESEKDGIGGERWRATESLLGAGGNFLSGLGELAQKMRNVRYLAEAFGRFTEAWAPAAPEPFVGPPAPPPPPESFPLHPGGWTETPTAHRYVPEMEEKPLDVLGDDWRKKLLPENEMEMSDDDMAEFRQLLADRHPTSRPSRFDVDENWQEEKIPTAQRYVPEMEEKPLGFDSRPLPFETIPAENWTPTPETPEPEWAKKPPEIGLGSNWQPEKPPDLTPPKSVSEGWQDWQPALPLSAKEGYREPESKSPSEPSPWLPEDRDLQLQPDLMPPKSVPEGQQDWQPALPLAGKDNLGGLGAAEQLSTAESAETRPRLEEKIEELTEALGELLRALGNKEDNKFSADHTGSHGRGESGGNLMEKLDSATAVATRHSSLAGSIASTYSTIQTMLRLAALL